MKWLFHLSLLHVPWSWFATFLCVILRPHTYCLVSRHIYFYILWPNGINGWKSSLKLLILRIEITAYNNHLDGAYSRSLHLRALIFKYRSYLSVKRCHDISLLNLLNWRVWAAQPTMYSMTHHRQILLEFHYTHLVTVISLHTCSLSYHAWRISKSNLMLLVANLANTKWCKKPKKDD